MSEEYTPNAEAWLKYKNNGGSAERRPRTISAEQDNLVQLTGVLGYWWKRAQLIPSSAELSSQPEAKRPERTEATCVIEVPIRRLSAEVCAGDLRIEYEGEADEDCEGEDCKECSGEGCVREKPTLSAIELLDHLLGAYENSAETFAEEFNVDRSDVDTIYRDLMVLVRSIRVKGRT